MHPDKAYRKLPPKGGRTLRTPSPAKREGAHKITHQQNTHTGVSTQRPLLTHNTGTMTKGVPNPKPTENYPQKGVAHSGHLVLPNGRAHTK